MAESVKTIAPDYSRENKASFFARLEGQVLPSQLVKIKTAYMIAKHAHRAQMRKELGWDGKNLRYFEHVRRVALIVLDNDHPLYPGWRWEDVCAALLHDTIEDTKDVTAEILEELFGPEVCKLVMIMTKWPGKKDHYVNQVRGGGERGVYLKMCDRLDNLRSLRKAEVGEEFQEKQRKETREIWMPGPFSMFRHTPIWEEMYELSGYVDESYEEWKREQVARYKEDMAELEDRRQRREAAIEEAKRKIAEDSPDVCYEGSDDSHKS